MLLFLCDRSRTFAIVRNIIIIVSLQCAVFINIQCVPHVFINIQYVPHLVNTYTVSYTVVREQLKWYEMFLLKYYYVPQTLMEHAIYFIITLLKLFEEYCTS